MEVLIYDKSRDLRKFYNSLITSIYPHSQIHKTDNQEELLFWSNEHKQDLVIIDIDSMGGHLLETIANVRLKNPAVVIIVLTHFPESLIRNKLANHGIFNYFDRASQLQEFIEVIKSVPSKIVGLNNNYILQDIPPKANVKYA